MEDRDPYSVLGVNRDASDAEIRNAYHKLARLLHPDKFDRDRDPRRWKDAHEVFKNVTEAYAVLRDRKRRAPNDRPQTKASSSPANPNPARPKKRKQTQGSPPDPGTGTAAPIRPLASGHSLFSTLPSTVRRRLTYRQRGGARDQVWLSTGRLADSIGLVAFFFLWFPALALIITQTWSLWTFCWTAGVTLILATLSVKPIRDIIASVNSPLQSRLYATRLYIISTNAIDVSWWPLYLLRDTSITHHYHNDEYRHSTLELDVLESRLDFTLLSKSESDAEKFVATLQKQYRLFMAAAHKSNWSYFAENDDFADFTESNKRQESGIIFTRMPAVVSLSIFLACYGVVCALSYQPTTNAEERPSALHDPAGTHAFPNHNWPAQKITGLESASRPNGDAINEREDAAIEGSLDARVVQPPMPLPPNGDVRQYSGAEPIAPLGIKTVSKGVHYFVKLVDPITNSTITTVFIRAGNDVSIKVPVGQWEMKYAVGRTWRGEEALFGRGHTRYFEADKLFNFYIDGEQVNGYAVDLIRQVNGNLTKTEIPPEAW